MHEVKVLSGVPYQIRAFAETGDGQVELGAHEFSVHLYDPSAEVGWFEHDTQTFHPAGAGEISVLIAAPPTHGPHLGEPECVLEARGKIVVLETEPANWQSPSPIWTLVREPTFLERLQDRARSLGDPHGT